MHIQNSSSIKNNWITFGGIDIVNPKKVIIEIPALDEFLANKKKRTLNIKKILQSLVMQNLISGVKNPQCLGIYKESNQMISLN